MATNSARRSSSGTAGMIPMCRSIRCSFVPAGLKIQAGHSQRGRNRGGTLAPTDPGFAPAGPTLLKPGRSAPSGGAAVRRRAPRSASSVRTVLDEPHYAEKTASQVTRLSSDLCVKLIYEQRKLHADKLRRAVFGGRPGPAPGAADGTIVGAAKRVHAEAMEGWGEQRLTRRSVLGGAASLALGLAAGLGAG